MNPDDYAAIQSALSDINRSKADARAAGVSPEAEGLWAQAEQVLNLRYTDVKYLLPPMEWEEAERMIEKGMAEAAEARALGIAGIMRFQDTTIDLLRFMRLYELIHAEAERRRKERGF